MRRHPRGARPLHPGRCAARGPRPVGRARAQRLAVVGPHGNTRRPSRAGDGPPPARSRQEHDRTNAAAVVAVADGPAGGTRMSVRWCSLWGVRPRPKEPCRQRDEAPEGRLRVGHGLPMALVVVGRCPGRAGSCLAVGEKMADVGLLPRVGSRAVVRHRTRGAVVFGVDPLLREPTWRCRAGGDAGECRRANKLHGIEAANVTDALGWIVHHPFHASVKSRLFERAISSLTVSLALASDRIE